MPMFDMEVPQKIVKQVLVRLETHERKSGDTRRRAGMIEQKKKALDKGRYTCKTSYSTPYESVK